MTEDWAGGSRTPIVFKRWGGLDNAQHELIEEFQFMLTRPEFVRNLVHNVVNYSVVHHGSEGITADLEELYEAVEADSENLAAIEFAVEHSAEHLVIEGLAAGLGHLAEMAAHGGIAAVTFESTAMGLEIVGSVLAHPVIIGASAVHTAFLLRRHFHSKDARSRSFAVGLVSKADCISNKVALHREGLLDEQNQLLDYSFLSPEFEAVCGKATESALVDQMLKTNAAMVELFNEFKGIGKCVFPEGPRAWSKSNCVHTIYDDLRSHEGEPGILYSAFSLAAAYGHESDEILSKPIYAQWFQQYFNISMPQGRDVREDLIRVRDSVASTVSDKATVCISIVGLHRAFERVFVRLKTALQIYMHTFARHKVHYSTRTIQYPCRRVFREFEDRAEGLCKDGTDLPVVVPDTAWLEQHAQHLSDIMLNDVGACIEDTHPEFAVSLFGSAEEGENEHEGADEE